MDCSEYDSTEGEQRFKEFLIEIDASTCVQEHDDLLFAEFIDEIQRERNLFESVVQHHVRVLKCGWHDIVRVA